jgi:hypothetical protein
MEPVDPRIDPRLVPDGSRAAVVAEHQEDYVNLPSIITPAGTVISRWTLTDEERRLILEGEDIFLSCYTFGHPLQPVLLNVGPLDYSKDV